MFNNSLINFQNYYGPRNIKNDSLREEARYDQIIRDIKNAPSDSYVILYVDWCPYSMKALEHLESKGLKHKKISIADFSRMNLYNYLKKANLGVPEYYRTVPLIFKNGTFYGGSETLIGNK